MQPSNLVTIITQNRNSIHIVDLINLFQEQNIPTFIQANREHLEGYFTSQRQRKFVVVDNFDGDVHLGSDFTSAAIYLIGYPKSKNYSANIYCQIPTEVIKHYKNFSRLGTIHFRRSRLNSSTSQVSKVSQTHSKIKLKTVKRISGANTYSSLSMTSCGKINGKNNLLIYVQGNQSNDYYQNSLELNNKFQRSKIIKSISQLTRFFQQKRRNEVFILASDLNSDKILPIVQYDFQVILHCNLQSKCMSLTEDKRVVISSTDFQQIRQFIQNLNFPVKTKKVEYGNSPKIADQPRRSAQSEQYSPYVNTIEYKKQKQEQQKQMIADKPKKSILKKFKRQNSKIKKQTQQIQQGQQNQQSKKSIRNQYFADEGRIQVEYASQEEKPIQIKKSINLKKGVQKIDFAVQSSLAQIPIENLVPSKVIRDLKISSSQVSVCQKGDSSKRHLDSISQFSKQSKVLERQSSARSIHSNQQNQVRNRTSSSNINVNIIMKPSYPQNQYKIRQEYGVNNKGQQIKVQNLKIPRLSKKFDKLSDIGSNSSLNSNSKLSKKIVLKKKLIPPQIHQSESVRSLSQSIRSNRSKKIQAKRNSKNSYMWKNEGSQKSDSDRSSFKNERGESNLRNNDSGYYTGEYFYRGNGKNSYQKNPFKNTDPTNFIGKKQYKMNNSAKNEYFQRTFPLQRFQTQRKSNLVFLIEDQIYKLNFDGRNFLGQNDKAFIHYNKNQLSDQILIQENKSEFILIISPFFTQKIAPNKIMRVQVGPYNNFRYDSQVNILVSSYSEINSGLFNKLKEHSYMTFNRLSMIKQIEAVVYDEESPLIRNFIEEMKFKKGYYENWKFFAFSNLKEYVNLLIDSREYQEKVLVISEYNQDILNEMSSEIPQFIILTIFMNQASRVKIPNKFVQKVKILHVNQYHDPFDQLENIISGLQ